MAEVRSRLWGALVAGLGPGLRGAGRGGVLLLAWLPLVWGCPPPPAAQRGPEDVLRAYRGALAQGDDAAAWALAPPSRRAAGERAAFDEQVEARRAEALARLDAPQGLQSLRDLQTCAAPLRLLWEDGAWWVEPAPGPPSPLVAARAALRRLVSALETADAAALAAFVPPEYASELGPTRLAPRVELERTALQALGARLRPHVDDPLELQGDRVLLRYEGRSLVLARGPGGVWWLLDPG